MANLKKTIKQTTSTLKKFHSPLATKLFLAWLLTLLVGFLLSKYVYHVSFDYVGTKLYDWDGGWYLRIVRHGYPDLKASAPNFGNKALAFFQLTPS